MAPCLLRLALIARVGVCTFALAFSSQAQHSSVNEGVETESEVLVKAEAALQVVASQQPKHIDILRNAARKLTSILQLNPATPYRQRVEEDLVQVQEILAHHDLAIASFYMDTMHGIRKGAQPRLLEIARAYPRFSQMDEVLLRLARIAVRDERPDDAATYLWKLVCRYPTSSKRPLAFERLEEVGFRSWQGCDKFEQ